MLASAALALPTTPSFSLGTDVTKLIHNLSCHQVAASSVTSTVP